MFFADEKEKGADIFSGFENIKNQSNQTAAMVTTGDGAGIDEISELVFECSAVYLPVTYRITGKGNTEYVKLTDLLRSLSLSRTELIIKLGKIETLTLNRKDFESKVTTNIIGCPVKLTGKKYRDVTLVKLTTELLKFLDIERERLVLS